MTPTQLQKTLDRHGITQMELSRAFGVSPRTVRRWVLDERGIPPLVVKVMNMLNAKRITIDEVKSS